MSLSHYRNYFNSEEEFESFKSSFPSLVERSNTLYNSLINYGHTEFRAKQVVAENLHSSFSMARNHFIQNQG